MNRLPVEEKRRILVLDEDCASHDLLRSILTPATGVRYELESACWVNDGPRLVKQALVEGRPFALAFVGIGPPSGWDGLDAIREIWAEDPEIQIVCCPGEADFTRTDLRLFLLRKPFDPAEVLQLARALTEKWWVQQQLQQTQQTLQAEVQELMWNSAFLEALVNSSNDGTLVVDEQGSKVFQNQRFDDLFKIPQHIADEKDDQNRLRWVTDMTKHPDEFVARVLHLYAHPKEIGRDEIELQDGTIIDRYSSAVVGKDGKYFGRIWTFRDITAARQAEDALRDSDEKFHQLADNITDVFWIRSPDLRQLHYVSPAFERIWGRPSQSQYANPQQWSDLAWPEDRERVLSAFAALTRDAPTLDIEYRIVRPDGEVRWVHTRGFQVRDGAGKLIRLTGIVSDITERKQAEEALRESEERFSGAFEHASIGMALVSPKGHFLKVNPALCELVGYSEAELRRRTFQDITYPEDLEIDLENVRQVLAGEILSYQMEKRYVHRGGHLVTVLLNVSLVRHSQGQPRYFIAQVLDITERERLKGQLFQSQKMETVGKLAGGIAHEFNSILTTILGHAELLLSELPDGGRLTESLGEINREAGRAANLTRQLLAYSRRQFLQPEVLDFNQVISAMQGLFHSITGTDVHTQMALAPGLQAVKADAGQIEEVIINLVINAREAMPHGGTLRLETANAWLDPPGVGGDSELKEGQYVMLTITDTGTGMSAEVRERAFEPFFTTKGVGQGTGLGLSTCYGIIKQSGGHISVSSEIGRGTCFTLYLPAVERRETVSRQPQAAGDLPGGNETVLLVEEDASLRGLAANLLRRLGYTVLSAADGSEALILHQQPDSGSIDVLFTDVVMPQMSGLELSERVRELCPGTRILFACANTPGDVHPGALKQGVAFLQKPFTPSALAHTLRELLAAPILEYL